MADQFAYTPEIIQENREMLSQAHLDFIIDNFPLMELNKGLFTSHSKPKEKQIKKPWTEKEQKLFLEGIEKFGMKSNLNLYKYIFYICFRFKKCKYLYRNKEYRPSQKPSTKIFNKAKKAKRKIKKIKE